MGGLAYAMRVSLFGKMGRSLAGLLLVSFKPNHKRKSDAGGNRQDGRKTETEIPTESNPVQVVMRMYNTMRCNA